MNTTTVNTQAELNPFAIATLTRLGQGELTLEEAWEDFIAPYSCTSFENYVSLEYQGFYYSTSSPEQQKLWGEALAYIEETHPADVGFADVPLESGDMLDWQENLHHTGCIEAGLALIKEQDEHLTDPALYEALYAAWSTLPQNY